MLFSDLKTKKIYSLTDAVCVGEPTGMCVLHDSFRCSYIVLSNSEKNILAYEDMYACADIITIKSTNVLIREFAIDNCFMLKIGTRIADVSGIDYDILEDIEIRGRSGFLICKSKKIKFDRLISASAEIIFVDLSGKWIVKSKSQDASAEQNKVLTTRNANNNLTVDNILKMPKTNRQSYVSIKPLYAESDNKLTLSNDFNFLVGRRVEREITDITRTFVVKEGTVVTTAIVNAARRAGKLADLTINSIKL
ncbi:MAG: hypothetical protein LBE09_08470 [Christensenellaceae bacterium]|jgi:hypothetical protein|nr:hypothetical protein [Christensenellaceae bacterium]